MAGASFSSSSRFRLRPCSAKPTAAVSNSPPLEPADQEAASASSSSSSTYSAPIHGTEENGGDAGKGKVANLRRNKRERNPSASSSASSFGGQHRGVRLRRRRRRIGGQVGSAGGGKGDDVQELALPLGMSFAAIVAQVVKLKGIDRERIPGGHLSTVCISAVKEAVENVYGERFGCFLKSFEKAFGSTFKTLQVISEANAVEDRNLDPPLMSNLYEVTSSQGDTITQLSKDPEIHLSSQYVRAQSSHVASTSEEQTLAVEPSQTISQENNTLVLHGEVPQHLACIAQSRGGLGFNNSILSTFERSVNEQARSNDLKEFEIGLRLKNLKLKQSQLDLNFYANCLEKIKISMGFSKAHFKEEKLKNQMQDLRHAELIRRCIDILVAGLVIMTVSLAYGTWVYSHRRIIEATASCMPLTKETKSWWVPKQMASFNSSWNMLRCHVVVLSRMSFGLLMIIAVAYSLFQRSSGPMMPVTFILLVLGSICGFAGKFCVDTLGGSGYWWLLHWEVLCLLHFFVNAFPSIIHLHLYGPVALQVGKGDALPPYWIRRTMFYSLLVVILPISAGFIPFASFEDWRRHFIDMALPREEEV